MTTQEMNYKLAIDIARLKMILTKNNNTTLSKEIVKVMKQLDDNKEEALLEEIKSALENKTRREKLLSILSPQYLKIIVKKLQTRIETKTNAATKRVIRTFDKSDYSKAERFDKDELIKAFNLIDTALKRNKSQAIINTAALEVFGYNLDLAKERIVAMFDARNQAIDITLQFIDFEKDLHEKVERLEKINYYNNWIYERYRPTGIVKVLIKN